jgi:hypothetical protein
MPKGALELQALSSLSERVVARSYGSLNHAHRTGHRCSATAEREGWQER